MFCCGYLEILSNFIFELVFVGKVQWDNGVSMHVSRGDTHVIYISTDDP